MKKVAAIYTAQAIVDSTTELIKEIIPDCEVINIVDDKLIADIISREGITKDLRKRILYYFQAGEATGADVILNTCSSIGEVADIARAIIKTPIVKIDEPMVEKAVKEGQKIGVLATLSTTLNPTVNLVYKKAEELDREIEVIEGLAGGAFEALINGDNDQHDSIIFDTAREIADQVDVFILAQGSMARMEEKLQNTVNKTVLSSPRLGVLEVKKIIKSDS